MGASLASLGGRHGSGPTEGWGGAVQGTRQARVNRWRHQTQSAGTTLPPRRKTTSPGTRKTTSMGLKAPLRLTGSLRTRPSLRAEMDACVGRSGQMSGPAERVAAGEGLVCVV